MRGFAELVLTLAVLAVTAGTVLPAVQKVREADQRANCAANLKRMGVAFKEFTDANGGRPPKTFTPPSRGYFLELLPYLEQDDVVKLWKPDRAWNDPGNQPATSAKMSVFLCPAVPGERVVKGLSAVMQNGKEVIPAQPKATGLPADYFIQAGWTDLAQSPILRGGMAPVKKIDQITDGLSNTLCFYECAGGPEVWRAGKSAGIIDPIDVWVWSSPHGRTLTSFTPDGKKLYGTCVVNCANAAVAPRTQPGAGVYGFHTGGANICMCDGSVVFVSSKMNALIMAAIVSVAGGEVVSMNEY